MRVGREEVNLLYVTASRAQRILVLEPSLAALLKPESTSAVRVVVSGGGGPQGQRRGRYKGICVCFTICVFTGAGAF